MKTNYFNSGVVAWVALFVFCFGVGAKDLMRRAPTKKRPANARAPTKKAMMTISADIDQHGELDDTDEAGEKVWTQKGVEILAERGLKEKIGRPKAGDTVTEEEKRKIEEMGYWAQAVKMGAVADVHKILAAGLAYFEKSSRITKHTHPAGSGQAGFEDQADTDEDEDKDEDKDEPHQQHSTESNTNNNQVTEDGTEKQEASEAEGEKDLEMADSFEAGVVEGERKAHEAAEANKHAFMEMFEGHMITSFKRDRSNLTNLTAKLDLAAKTISKARKLVATARAKKQHLEEPTLEDVELESLLESDTHNGYGSSRRRDCDPNIHSNCYCEHRRRRESLLQTTDEDQEEEEQNGLLEDKDSTDSTSGVWGRRRCFASNAYSACDTEDGECVGDY